VIAVAFFALPLAGLLWKAAWGSLWDDLSTPAARDALRLSIECSLWSTALSVLFGVPLAWVLARGTFPGRPLVRALVLLPMVILGGMLSPTHEMNGLMRLLAGAMPSRWAFEGLLLVETEKFPPPPDPALVDLAHRFFQQAGRSTLAGVTAVSCVMLALLIGATAAILKSRDVH